MSKIPELERRATKARSKRAGVKMQDNDGESSAVACRERLFARTGPR
jgi:hypothetical protein